MRRTPSAPGALSRNTGSDGGDAPGWPRPRRSGPAGRGRARASRARAGRGASVRWAASRPGVDRAEDRHVGAGVAAEAGAVVAGRGQADEAGHPGERGGEAAGVARPAAPRSSASRRGTPAAHGSACAGENTRSSTAAPARRAAIRNAGWAPRPGPAASCSAYWSSISASGASSRSFGTSGGSSEVEPVGRDVQVEERRLGGRPRGPGARARSPCCRG